MLSGGFGNQLHQLANGLCFSKEMETELFVDTSYYKKKNLKNITKLGPLLVDFGQAVNNYIDLLNFDNLLGICTTDATESYINYL